MHRSKARSLLTIVVMVISLFTLVGCDSPSEALLKPSITAEEEPDSGDINMRKYQILYTSCGTFVLDYPSDFEGPIPQGHGRIGQTDTSYYCSNATYIGDPTADD